MVIKKIKNEMMENKDSEQKEKERWDLKRRIIVASV